jgi:hypothetical protein
VALLCAAAPAGAAVRATGPAGRALPASPAGLSVETDLLPDWFGPRGCQSPVREVLRMAGRPEIRIGGDSQDRLQVGGVRFFHAVHCLGATGSPVLLGLDLLHRDPQASGDLLAAAAGLVPRGRLTIAIGNEPNLYRPRLPDFAAYLDLYGTTLGALKQRFGATLPPVAGPDPATWRWANETAQFIGDVHPAQATVHLYGLNGCGRRPGAPGYPTVAQLLDPAASAGHVLAMSAVARAARAAGIRAQIDESNSVTCRGTPGVSDTPASALWALSTLGAATATGFDHVQFHASRGFYDAFVLGRDGTVAFRPLWTAILLADALWPDRTRPLRLSGPLETGLGAWAARRPDGGLAVLAVNRDLVRSRVLRVRTAQGTGLLGRLQARGARSVTLNGRRLVWSAGHPVWRGLTRIDVVRADRGSVRAVLPPASAAWLVLGGRGGIVSPATLTL